MSRSVIEVSGIGRVLKDLLEEDFCRDWNCRTNRLGRALIDSFRKVVKGDEAAPGAEVAIFRSRDGAVYAGPGEKKGKRVSVVTRVEVAKEEMEVDVAVAAEQNADEPMASSSSNAADAGEVGCCFESHVGARVSQNQV